MRVCNEPVFKPHPLRQAQDKLRYAAPLRSAATQDATSQCCRVLSLLGVTQDAGRENAKGYLEENPKELEKVMKEVKAFMGVDETEDAEA